MEREKKRQHKKRMSKIGIFHEIFSPICYQVEHFLTSTRSCSKHNYQLQFTITNYNYYYQAILVLHAFANLFNLEQLQFQICPKHLFLQQSWSLSLPSSVPHSCIATLQHGHINPVLVQLHLFSFLPTQIHSGLFGLTWIFCFALQFLCLEQNCLFGTQVLQLTAYAYRFPLKDSNITAIKQEKVCHTNTEYMQLSEASASLFK